MTRPDWNDYFLEIARAVARRADCRRAKHGCVIVKNNRIVSTGYNGSPAHDPHSCLGGDCPRGLKTTAELAHNHADYSDCIAVHAEQNAISYARYEDLQGAVLYITGAPCDGCSKLIKAAGIAVVVW